MRALIVLGFVSLGLFAVSSQVAAGRQNATLVMRVVNDLNENGVRDEGEPGLAGWSALVGCGDAFVSAGPTGPDGTFVHDYFSGDNCVNLSVEFGWFATSPKRVVVEAPSGGQAEATFLVRHVGDDVQRFVGIPIVNGLPALATASVNALVDGVSCGDGMVTQSFGWTRYELYVLSDAERTGCAQDGDSISFTIDGAPADSTTYENLDSSSLDLIVGPAPMYFRFWYSSPPLDGAVTAQIDGQPCGQGFPSTGGGLVPPNFQYVFVRAANSQGGCGVPGDVINLGVGGAVVGQFLWQEGLVQPQDMQRLGDANCDAASDSVDAALMLQLSAGLRFGLRCRDAADVNRDGIADAVDAALVLQLEAGLIDYFP